MVSPMHATGQGTAEAGMNTWGMLHVLGFLVSPFFV